MKLKPIFIFLMIGMFLGALAVFFYYLYNRKSPEEVFAYDSEIARIDKELLNLGGKDKIIMDSVKNKEFKIIHEKDQQVTINNTYETKAKSIDNMPIDSLISTWTEYSSK